jgi:hypothetical protein
MADIKKGSRLPVKVVGGLLSASRKHAAAHSQGSHAPASCENILNFHNIIKSYRALIELL